MPHCFQDVVIDRILMHDKSAKQPPPSGGSSGGSGSGVGILPASLRPDQCTVNEYLPGQGIAPHVDTHAAFDDAILSLSMGSGIVMEFRRQRRTSRRSKKRGAAAAQEQEQQQQEEEQQQPSGAAVPPTVIRQRGLLPESFRDLPKVAATEADVTEAENGNGNGNENGNGNGNGNENENENEGEGGASEEDEGGDESERVPVWLPPRSLLVLRGEARYEWSHGIAPRKLDRVGGQLTRRGTRVSLTFRRVLPPGTLCRCGGCVARAAARVTI
jgi:hypothetical protein